MKIDTSLLVNDLKEMPALAQAAEAAGFDGIWTAETAHDAFLPLVLAAEHSQHLSLGTSIAVAFARSPASLAYIAWDIARYSKGRFILGLGTQVKGHNERRFGVKWEKPVKKLREYILAIHALWDSWQHGTKLNFSGDFFKLTLMTPFFNPGPHAYSDVPIYIAGVNKLMCRLAGELCQGFHVHPLHTIRYLEEIVLPNIQHGLEKSGRQRTEIELYSSVFVIPTDDAQAAQHEFKVRQQLSFYASTPAYKVVLDVHGWAGVAQQLSALAAQGKWNEMPALINDEMLDVFAVRGSWAELPHKIQTKYRGGLLDRVSYYMPYRPGTQDEQWRVTTTGFK